MIADMVGNRTLKSQWDETVRYYGENLFLKYISVQDEISCFTYKEFDRNVKQIANLLIDLGIQKGDFVALQPTGISGLLAGDCPNRRRLHSN